MNNAKEKIIGQIKSWGPGSVFTAKDFTHIASRGTTDVTLTRLADDGVIRKLGRGLFDSPKTNPALGGILSPDTDQAAQAIARKFRWTIIPEGALAANQLGLSQQVPAKLVYLSDGPTKTIAVGDRKLHFKHARPKEMRAENYASGLVIQALRYLGKAQVDQKVLTHLRDRLSSDERAKLLEDTRYSADWIYEAVQQIGED